MRRQRPRRGMVLLELVAAAAVLTAAAATLVPVLSAAAHARRASARRLLALEELRSVIELNNAAGGGTAGLLNAKVRPEAARYLGGADLSAEFSETGPAGRPAVLTLTFGDGRSETLTTWLPAAEDGP